MTSAANDRIKSTVDDVKGRSKIAVGELIDDEELIAEGRKDRASGELKGAVADVKEKIDEVVKKVTKK